MGDGGVTRSVRDRSIACDTAMDIWGGEGVTGAAALGGAGAFDGILCFFGALWLLFFGRSKKDPDPLDLGPSDASTSKIKTNIHFFPFANGQRGGSRAMARRTRCV